MHFSDEELRVCVEEATRFGRLDLFVGNVDGRIFYYRNESTVAVAEPRIGPAPSEFSLLPIYPNPFDSEKFCKSFGE